MKFNMKNLQAALLWRLLIVANCCIVGSSFAFSPQLEKVSRGGINRAAASNRRELIHPEASISDSAVQINVTFEPGNLLQLMSGGDAKNLTLTVWYSGDDIVSAGVRLELDGSDSLLVEGLPNVTLPLMSNPGDITVELRGMRIGRRQLRVTLELTSSVGCVSVHKADTNGFQVTAVIPPYAGQSVIGLLCMFTALAVNLLGFACPVTKDELRRTFKHPGALINAILSQFIILPIISYLIGVAFRLPAWLQYTMLALGCTASSPPINLSSLLIGADVTLCVVLTCFTTIVALLSMPLWMGTLGKAWLESYYPTGIITNPYIPWRALGIFAVLLTGPTFLGVFLAWLHEKFAFIMSIVIRILAVLTMTIGLSLYISDNFHWMAYFLGNWVSMCAFSLLTAVGYLKGYPWGRLVWKQPVDRSLSIMLQNGIRSGPMAAAFAMQVLPAPESSIATFYVLAYNFVAIFPVVALFIARIVCWMIHHRDKDYDMGSEDDEKKSTGKESGDTISLSSVGVVKTEEKF